MGKSAFLTGVVIKPLAVVALSAACAGPLNASELPEAYGHVDQVIWVVSDAEKTMTHYQELGFSGIMDLGRVQITSASDGQTADVRWICANLGGARVNWIKPDRGNSLFNLFLKEKGEGAMALVHRFPGHEELESEVERLNGMGIPTLERITLRTCKGQMTLVLLDTGDEGKYALGLVAGEEGEFLFSSLGPGNRNNLKLNQYAFAIRDPEPVSGFWERIGMPPFQMNHPELGSPHYYGNPADHDLMQGWQRHGDIAYEWCIPLQPPIVYEDHLQLHGEGIHHIAFSVEDMDGVLEDFTTRGYVVSMGGTWGEEGKPGSGRYEYIELEDAGGVTMELLWNFREQ